MALETYSRCNQHRREIGNVELSILPKDATAIALAGYGTQDPSIKSPMRYLLRYGGSLVESHALHIPCSTHVKIILN